MKSMIKKLSVLVIAFVGITSTIYPLVNINITNQYQDPIVVKNELINTENSEATLPTGRGIRLFSSLLNNTPVNYRSLQTAIKTVNGKYHDSIMNEIKKILQVAQANPSFDVTGNITVLRSANILYFKYDTDIKKIPSRPTTAAPQRPTTQAPQQSHSSVQNSIQVVNLAYKNQTPRLLHNMINGQVDSVLKYQTPITVWTTGGKNFEMLAFSGGPDFTQLGNNLIRELNQYKTGTHTRIIEYYPEQVLKVVKKDQ